MNRPIPGFPVTTSAFGGSSAADSAARSASSYSDRTKMRDSKAPKPRGTEQGIGNLRDQARSRDSVRKDSRIFNRVVTPLDWLLLLEGCWALLPNGSSELLPAVMLVPGGREVVILWIVKEFVDYIRLGKGVLSEILK